MKIGLMFRDISQSLIRRPVTERYPYVRTPTPARLRGLLHWNPEKCTGCGLCVKDCPSFAINMIEMDKKAKRFVLSYQLDRCTFCGQCVTNCRQGCLSMSNEEWELAALGKELFRINYGEESDVEYVLARESQTDIELSE